MKTISEDQIAMLRHPLPKEAVSKHPTKPYDSIKAIYVTERLNKVFGIGSWRTKVEAENESEYSTKNGTKRIMVVVKTTFEIPDYGIYFEQYGGNDNDDRGDAYKGAVTDAITKIGSYLEIGIEVFKGKGSGGNNIESQMPDGVSAVTANGFPMKTTPNTSKLSIADKIKMGVTNMVKQGNKVTLQEVEETMERVKSTPNLTDEEKESLLVDLNLQADEIRITPPKKVAKI